MGTACEKAQNGLDPGLWAGVEIVLLGGRVG